MFTISYQIVEDFVLTHGGTVSAAEAHGILAGMLCVDGEVDSGQWLSQIFGEACDDLKEGEDKTMLELYAESVKLMEAVDFSFELFLPDDEVSLTERANALCGWCEGFLYGVGYLGKQHAWTGDSEEILRDLTEISRLETGSDGEEDEIAYTEICEFVRIGVHLIRGDVEPHYLKNYLH